MKNSHSKLKKILSLVLGLTVGGSGAVYADSIDSVFNTPTGDFIFVTDYMHKVNRNEKTNIDELVKGGNTTRIYAVAPTEAIKSRIKFLNTKRAKEFYSEEQRLNLIGRYQNFLNELNRKNINPSKKSLEALSTAVMDGAINPEELENVEDNIYAIVKEGIDKRKGAYSVFYLTRLISERTSSQYESKIKELENAYNDLIKKNIEEKEYAEIKKELLEEYGGKETPKLSLEPKKEICAQVKLPLPEVPKETEKEKKDYTQMSLLTEANSNFAFNTFGATVGLRFAPFKDKQIGLGALLDVNFSLNKVIDSFTDSLSERRTAYGLIKDINATSIGILGELQYGPVFLGGGINYQNWIRYTTEDILDPSGNLIERNRDSEPNRQVFGKFYGGAEFPIGDVWKLGASIGYDGRNGAYFGLRNTFRLNSKKEKKE